MFTSVCPVLVINLLFTNFTSAENNCAISGEPNSWESDNTPKDFLTRLGIKSFKNFNSGLVASIAFVAVVVVVVSSLHYVTIVAVRANLAC